MKITQELKIQYFALYIEQCVLCNTPWHEPRFPINLTVGRLSVAFSLPHKPPYLSLRSVDQLTDEELKELCQLLQSDFPIYKLNKWKNNDRMHPREVIIITQWLCTKSVAVPYLGIPVEDWVAEGVVKIRKEDEK